MITLEIKNGTNSDFIDELKELIECYNDELEGTIIFDLKTITSDIKLTSWRVWEKYCKNAYKNKEDHYISDWSPNNGSEIGKLIKTNKILEKLTNRWYKNCERRESVNMIEIFEDLVYEYTEEYLEKEMSISKILNAIDNDEIKDENFVKDLLETIDVFYNRNPLFRYDW